jgi:3-oxoacyl-[acyl-carrier protein] reductase
MNFDNEFEGRRVVITGACGVYGRMLAKGFAAARARVCLTDRGEPDLQALFAEVSPAEGSFVQAADLTDDRSMEALLAAIGQHWGSSDILINNAGIYPSGFLLDIDAAEWDRIMDVNLRAPFVLTRGVALQMVKAGHGGSIVNIGSGASRKMRRSVVPYCTSKTALDRLTKGFALELAEYGIRVNALEPGFAAGSTASPLTDEHVKKVVSTMPLGRESTADDVVPATFYLCSQAASFVTGATLTVDGGNSAGTMDVYQAKKKAL